MSLQENSKIITIKSVREACFYAEWMSELDRGTQFPTSDEKLYIFQDELNAFIKEKNISDDAIAALERECAKSLLPETKFRWLIKSERATFWAYYYIFNNGTSFFDRNYVCEDKTISERMEKIPGWKSFKLKKEQRSGHSPDTQKIVREYLESYRLLDHEILMDHVERCEWIVSYFDYRGKLRTKDKVKAIARLRSKWGEVIRRDIDLGWIDVKNRELCRWAYKYLSDKITETKRFGKVNIRPDKNSSEELHDSCQLLVDYWTGEPDALRFLLLKLQKAWSQKKLRDSRKNMKAINVYISGPVKSMLDNIAQKKKVTQGELIEELVRKEYRRQK